MKFCGRRNAAARGFTLIEVVVAMTIVGLGVVTVLEIFSLGLRLAARSSAESEAATYGRQVMDELLARRKLDEGGDHGVIDATARWKVQVRSLRDSPGAAKLSSNWELREVDLELLVTDGGRDRRVDLKTLRLMRKGGP